VNASLQQALVYFRRNPFAISCGVLVVCLGIANYFFWKDHQQLTATHQTIQRSGEDMLLSLTSHSRITTELASVKEALAHIDQHLVNEGDLAENLGYFYQIETASRLRLSNVSQLSSMPPAADQRYKTVPFTIRTTGSYRQVLRVLRELETGPRLYKFQNFTLAQGAVVDDTAMVNLDLSLELLARP
jgi:Tfp pilus assembly protein PilO